MKYPSCIRAIPEFRKKGCPQKSWDGEEGCTAWIELSVASRANPQQREIKKQCIDLWAHEFRWANLGIMEGVQQATEGNRNMTAMQTLGALGRLSPERLQDAAERQLKIESKK